MKDCYCKKPYLEWFTYHLIIVYIAILICLMTKKIHIKLKVNEQLGLFQKREQGPGAPVEMDTPYWSTDSV
jgi:hypothetical protein